jgi:hypothetical protein
MNDHKSAKLMFDALPPAPGLGSAQAAATGLRERFGALPFPAAMG